MKFGRQRKKRRQPLGFQFHAARLSSEKFKSTEILLQISQKTFDCKNFATTLPLMPDATSQKKKRIRRTAQQKELDALNAVVAVLNPLTHEQRRRIWSAAVELMRPETADTKQPTA